MTEIERMEADQEIGRLRQNVIHPPLTLRDKLMRWVGALALVLSLGSIGYTYVSQQAALSCQAKILQNNATQDVVGQKLSENYRQLLRDQGAALDKVMAGVAANSPGLVVAGVAAYKQVTDEYAAKSETAAAERAKNPTTFTC